MTEAHGGATMTKSIPLTQGKFALVDDEDYGWLSQWKWCFLKEGYAVRAKRIPNNGLVYMHREILQTPPGIETDHINGNKLDNSRKNLRICTTSKNQANGDKAPSNCSGYKGVSWSKKEKKWRAQITHDKKVLFLGSFVNPKVAAQAYDKAAVELFGEFAKTNFVL
jgi:hypothetical protein